MQEKELNNYGEIEDKEYPELPEDRDTRIGSTVIDKTLSMTNAWVDRDSFLTKELRVHFPDDQVQIAISSDPLNAGIPIETIDEIADSIIMSHVRNAAAVSFVAGMPGGFAMAVTIPGDIAQLYRRQIRLAQELAYLYGWPDLRTFGEPDEETKYHITLLLGTMFGVKQASEALKLLYPRLQRQVLTRVPRQALTKTIYYPALKKTLKWIGISLTKKSFAGGLAKFIPVAGGVTSAGLTTVAIRRSARKLKKRLKELRYAQPPDDSSQGVAVE